jgi:hypothetical protein
MKVQKKDRKNITSDVMNRIIPIFRPLFTVFLCEPLILDSRSVSRHHIKDKNQVRSTDENVYTCPNLWNHKINESIRFNLVREETSAHGLISTA